jgi:hypothetical protein
MPPSRPITHTKFELIFVEVCPERPAVDTVQDFFVQAAQPRMYLVERSIYSLYQVIIRSTKIINNLLNDYKILIYQVIFQY